MMSKEVDSDSARRKIFIGGLNYSTDDEKLRKYFSAFGVVQDAVVMKDPVSRRSRGFGFITYLDIESLEKAIQVEPHTVDGRKVEAKRAVPRSETSPVGPRMSQGQGQGQVQGVVPYSSSAPQGVGSGSKITANVANGNVEANGAGADGAAPGNAADASAAAVQDNYAFNKIFVGGLHYDTRDGEFKAYFSKFGKIVSAEVMFNR